MLNGRFTVAGETHRRGIDPDWREGLPEDEEWRIEWVKFAWGLDLAHAAERTDDPAYQYAWERLTESWIRKVPPDADAAEVTARRILNWIYAWQRFGLEASTPSACSPASPTRSSTSAPTSLPRATTARSSSTRC